VRIQGYKYWKVYLGGKTKLTNNAKINTFLRRAVTWHEWRQEVVVRRARMEMAWAARRSWACCVALGACILQARKIQGVCSAPA